MLGGRVGSAIELEHKKLLLMDNCEVKWSKLSDRNWPIRIKYSTNPCNENREIKKPTWML